MRHFMPYRQLPNPPSLRGLVWFGGWRLNSNCVCARITKLSERNIRTICTLAIVYIQVVILSKLLVAF